ncbi:MAG: alpha/beta hydrolase [Myxococcota bacterium]|nr:alpha/beta hydrolase [Myxococcota bacterium]
MKRKLLLGLLTLASALLVWVSTAYFSWLGDTTSKLEAGSTVVATASGQIEYALWGESGPVVLFLHGTPGGYDQIADFGPPAVAQGYRVLAPSRPGYLRTPITVGRTAEEQADAFADLIRTLGIDHVAVIGLSGGGPSALEFALRHPDLCSAHIQLMGVSRARLASEQWPNPLDSTMTENPDSITNRLLSSNFAGWVLLSLMRMDIAASLETAVPDPKNRERILEKPEKVEAFIAMADSAFALQSQRIEGFLNDMSQFEDLEVTDLEAIRCPTRVVHGTADQNVPLAMGELVAGRVPNAEIVRIEGADHFMPVSHAEEVMSAILGFLDTQTAVRK